MDDLDDILNAYDQRLEKGKQQAVESSRANADLDVVFRDSVLPVVEAKFTEMKGKLEKRGHAARIVKDEDGLRFEFHPRNSNWGPGRHLSDIPHLIFYRKGETVQRYTCKQRLFGGGVAHVDGQYGFSEVTPELVEQSVVEVVRYALA